MITVTAFVLIVQLSSSVYSSVAVPLLPTLEDCNSLGIAMRAGATGSKHRCVQYKALVISQSGNVPNTNYLTAQ